MRSLHCVGRAGHHGQHRRYPLLHHHHHHCRRMERLVAALKHAYRQVMGLF